MAAGRHVRLSWKPLLGALVCAALGALIDHFVPQAETLAEAVRLWRASRWALKLIAACAGGKALAVDLLDVLAVFRRRSCR